MNLETVGRIPLTGDQPVARPLPTQDKANTEKQENINASSGIRTYYVMFQRTKTFYDAVVGCFILYNNFYLTVECCSQTYWIKRVYKPQQSCRIIGILLLFVSRIYQGRRWCCSSFLILRSEIALIPKRHISLLDVQLVLLLVVTQKNFLWEIHY
jgi:hypothetical protein